MDRNTSGDDLHVIPSIKRMHDTNGQSYGNSDTSPIIEQNHRPQRTRCFATVASFSLIGVFYWISLGAGLKIKWPNFHVFHVSDYSENQPGTTRDVPVLHRGNDFNWTNVSTYQAN